MGKNKKKKKIVEKVKDPEYILARAHKLFKRGNYEMARTEFEKVQGLSFQFDQNEITEKIEICKKLGEKQQAEELIKRGKKLMGKGNPIEAAGCFEAAYEFLKEDWLLEKITLLKQKASELEAGKSAERAESEGRYNDAAALYEQAYAGSENEVFLLKRAHCLVRANRYAETISILGESGLPDDLARYDYGFALAKTDRFYECLRVWEGITSKDGDFLEQRDEVRIMLLDDLHGRLERKEDFEDLYRQGVYLVSIMGNQDLTGLVEYIRFAWIEELWEQERYEEIIALLSESSREMDADLAAIHAKSSLKSAEASGTPHPDLPMFWLTVLYGRAFESVSLDLDERTRIRDTLLRIAEDRIRKISNHGDISSRGLFSLWSVEKKQIEGLRLLVGDSAEDLHLVCTPGFAHRYGKPDAVLSFIRKRKEAFSEHGDYLAMGAYYSSAGPSLLLVDQGEYDQAIACLPKTNREDEFTKFAEMKVNFLYGMHCIEEGAYKGVDQYFEDAADLFNLSPWYEDKLVEGALRAFDSSQLDLWFSILEKVHEKRPSKPINDMFSLIMSQRAVDMYNNDLITDKVLSIALTKSLKLNPENDHAIRCLEATEKDLEIMELDKALDRNKMNKACRIASESEFEQVREHFFSFLSGVVDEGINHTDFSKNEKAAMIYNVLKWCNKVDENHPLVERLHYLLDDND